MPLFVRHPHDRRLPKHARHIARQMLRPRATMRASVLETQVRQLGSAINHGQRGHVPPADSDRQSPGVRVMLGPETRSLVRQLLDSRDLRVQQQLARAIAHQCTRRILAAVKRARVLEKAAQRAKQAARWAGPAAARAGRKAAQRARRGPGAVRTTRTRHMTTTRSTALPGPETRYLLAVHRSRTRAGAADRTLGERASRAVVGRASRAPRARE